MKENIGKMKVMLERLMSYGALINFSMILYLYVQQNPLGIAWYIWAIALTSLLPIIAVIDWKFIFPSSLSIQFGKKNQEFADLREDIKRIENTLTSIEQLLKSMDNNKIFK